MKDHNHAVNWHSPSSSMLAFNRNLSVERAIKEEYDWLLFWDADIAVDEPFFIEKMIDTAYKYGAPVVGLPVVLKGDPKTYNYTLDGTHNENETHDKSVVVRNIGTGVMLIRTDVFKILNPPYFSFTDTYTDQPGVWPEDWGFCDQIGKLDKKIIMDPRFTVHHYGLKDYV